MPGTVGFVSKWYLAAGAFEDGMWLLSFLVMGSSFLAVIYVGRVIEVAWFREPSAAVAEISEAPLSLLIPTWVLTAACVVFGIDAAFTAGVAERAAAALLAGAL